MNYISEDDYSKKLKTIKNPGIILKHMKNKRQFWVAGPYPWLISSIAFLLPSINYFIKGDLTGGTIFLISTILFFINFLGRLKR